MPEHRPGRALATDEPGRIPALVSSCRLRLARLLAEMIPGARTLYVTLRGPAGAWPNPHGTAHDAAGRRIPLSRLQARTAARWTLRAFPEADWDQDHTFELRTGLLLRTPAPQAIASGGR
ncbi:transcriptional regulator [Streptomyces sp. LHD-70]|uniref:transcriptional regulator n=1 Tax=Streptomyces sp. LHD-70 TaxID=3072140 RepID=UPI00280CA9CA|nr:transcriptional regulator [Streptomyces sp. LHD-70]MDQ8708239.1 transcriptional regulator [Streptomyces sp. LHD-70]